MGNQAKEIAKTYQVRLSDNALLNIDEITGYIAFINHQPMNAIKVGDAIFNTIDKIELSPFRYKECEQIPTKTKMYRNTICLSWYIIYKITGSKIIILGILHTSRKPSKIKALKRVK